MKRAVIVAAALAAAPAAWAEDVEPTEKRPLRAEVGLGIAITDGNSDTTSVNASGDVRYGRGPWRHRGRAEAFRSSADSETTAERYQGTGKTDYHLNDRNYVYGLLGYEADRFSGYDYQATASLGYGRDLIVGDRVNLSAEAGVGGRRYKETDTGETDSEATLRFAGTLDWSISESATFTQELDTTIGDDMTVTNSTTSLSTQVVGNLAMKLAVHVRHISDVPPDTKKRDTKFTANLVYQF